MAKQLNIDLRFNADTSQAKKAIQELQTSLSDIAKMPGKSTSLFDDAQIKAASKAALELQDHLQKAVNINTSKLDLSRFASSLKTSKKDLSSYANTLVGVGEQGQQAFLKLAQAIAVADTPTARINSKIADLGVTLKNTAKWQISSSVLHGFMGAIQSAYGYAQDLNKSLNNIRIVTGANIDEMSRFAGAANKAAKALSTTTTDYTNASLIYYQQGLSDAQVQERTDITIKMANAANQSAEIVSDQMTAVWNNFDDGSKSLEYYADVMTALGAATASSTDEIAQGLEKFAAVSETVGLSYEYATAALATVTDKTRQSADVVGTAFKTMFARIEGLELGETLEDGTDLNQYSQALMAVGVNIKNSNGELKNMDQILNEMANVWETLNRDEKVALAQKVAGVRQYNQLMSLMENWDAMETNLNVVSNSEGSLQKQADIYAEGWEAASDRVRAAAEGIYQNLIDDEFFIDLLNGFELLLDGINGIVESFGGMKGVISLIGSVFLSTFADKMPAALNNLHQNFKVFTGQSKKDMLEMQSDLDLKIKEYQADSRLSESYKFELEGISKVNAMKKKLIESSKFLTNEEKEAYEFKIKNVQAMYKEIAALAEKKKIADKEAETTAKRVKGSSKKTIKDVFKDYDKKEETVTRLEEKATTPFSDNEDTRAYIELLKEAKIEASKLEDIISQISTVADLTSDEVNALMMGKEEGGDLYQKAQEKIQKAVDGTTESFRRQIKERTNLESLRTSVTSQAKAWQNVSKELNKVKTSTSGTTKVMISTVENTKKKMLQYLEIIKKVSKENGLAFDDSIFKNMSKQIASMDVENIEEITKKFSDFALIVDKESSKKIDVLDENLDDLRDTLGTLEFDKTDIENMAKAEEEAAEAAYDLANSMDNVDSASKESVEGTFHMSTALADFASSAMAVCNMINVLKNSFQTFGDNEAGAIEKVSAAMAILMSIMTTYTSLKSFAETLSKNAIIMHWAEAKAEDAKTKAIIKGTAAKWAENSAWLASPITWILGVIVAVVAAIAALTLGLVALTNRLKEGKEISTKHCDILIKQAEKTKELANANIELSDSMEDLIEEYTKLSVLGEDTTTVFSQMKDNMPELIESYKDLAEQVEYSADKIKELEAAGNLAFLTGDFSQFNDLKNSIDEELLELSAESAKSGSISASTKLAAGMQDVHSVKNTGSKIEFTLGGAQLGGADDDEIEALKILKKEMGVKYYHEDNGLFTKGAKLTANWKNPTELVDYYEKMVKARNEMLDKMSEEQREESDTFRELNEMINATSEAYDEAKEQAEEYIEIAGKSLMVKFEDDFTKADNMEEFLAVRKEYLKVATTQYDLSDEQALAYLNEAAALSEVSNQYQLATIMAEKFNGIDLKSEDGKKIADEYYKEISKSFEGLNEKELQVAISLMGTVDSLEEFKTEFELTMLQVTESGYQASADMAKDILKNSLEANKIDMSGLLSDENFKQYLEEQNLSIVSLTAKSYEEQYSIVSQYYSKMNELIFESTEIQENAISLRIASLQKELTLIHEKYNLYKNEITAEQNDYLKKQSELQEAEQEGKNTSKIEKELEKMEIEFKEKYEFSITSNIADIQGELNGLFEQLDQLQNKKIEMAMDWSGVDQIEGSMEKIASFSKTMKKEAEIVGDSYQLTAAQAREWLEFYPELSNIATVTSDGIVQMNAAEVDAFIEGKDAELDASIDAEIERLEIEKTSLKQDLEIRKKELEAAEKIAQGEINLEEVSAQYLVDLRKNLTEYFIENKADEVNASRLALETMGLNEEEYSRLVAEAAKKNAENMSKSAEDGANAQVDTLGQLIQKWGNFSSFLIDNVGTVLADLIKAAKEGGAKGIGNYFKDLWDSTPITTDTSDDYEGYNSNTKFETLDDFQKKAIYEEASRKQIDSINTYIKELENSINSISGQQDYLKALKNQDLSEYGDTSLDKDKDEEEKIKQLEEEIERYHEINEELEDLNRNLDKVSKAKDKAFGKKKLALIDQEIAATEELIDATQRYINEAETHFNNDAARLNAFGAQYDSAGRIANYDEMYSRELSLYNAAQATGDEAIIEAAEKRYEDFKKVLDNYEDSLNTLEEQEDQLQDYVDQIAEMKLAKIEYQIELEVELNQADLDQIDYQLNMLGDTAFKEAEQLILLQQKAAYYEAQSKAYNGGVESLLSQKGLSQDQIKSVQSGNMSVIQGKDFSASEIELIQNSIKGLQDTNLALMELNQQIRETLPASFEAWNEKIDENLEKFSYYSSVGEHFKNIADIVGSKPFGITSDFLREMNLVAVANKKNEIEALTTVQKNLEEERKIAEQNLLKAKTEEDKKYWENMVNTITNRQAEIQEKILSSTEETLQKITDIYTKEIQNSLDRFEEQVSGSFGTLEKLQEAYNKEKSLKDQYISDYKKLYELNKLNRQLNDAIDDTDSIKNKKLLQKLQDEINEAMKSENKLSEYDLEVLQKKYDLKLAEAALDDAQNAKTQVKLVRNLEGNYNYVYTADTEDIDNAMQNYEDKIFALQDLNETYIEDMGAKFIEVQKEMTDALSKIQLSDFESYTDYKKAVDETAAYYQERLQFYSLEMQKGLDYNISLYENEYLKCAEFNDLKFEDYKLFTTKFEETILGKLNPDMHSIIEYQEDVNNAICGSGGLLDDLSNGYLKWYDLTNSVLETLGVDTTNFAEVVAAALIGENADSVASALGITNDEFSNLEASVSEYIAGSGGLNDSVNSFRNTMWNSVYGEGGIDDASSDVEQDIEDLSTSAKIDFKNIEGYIVAWEKTWRLKFQNATTETNNLITAYGNLVNKLSAHQSIPDLQKTIRIVTEEVKTQSYSGGGSTSNYGGGSTSNQGNEATYNTDKRQTATRDTQDKKIQAGDKVWATNGWGPSAVYNYSSSGTPTAKNYSVRLQENNPGTIIKYNGHPLEIDTRRLGTMVFVQLSNGQVELIKKSELTGYDTGGYTGAWGSEGKLAMLHEKEIVLNKEDTSNMLQAVNVLREISTMLDLQAGQASAAALAALYSNQSSLLVNNSLNPPIEQNVQIYAEFPDATNHLELEQAFNNLINTASQYVNRKY